MQAAGASFLDNSRTRLNKRRQQSTESSDKEGSCMKLFYFKEESKFSLSSHENKHFYFYFFMPLVLGIFLGDGLGIDISQTTAKYIGLLRFIQSAGIDIRTKSMIFMLYLVFATCYWHSLFKHRKSPDPLKAKTVTDLVKMIALLLVGFLLAYAVIIIGFHQDALITPSRQIQFLLVCSRWDIAFAIYAGGLVWTMVLTLYFPLVITYELLVRLKNRISNVGRS
jgi:hypothetical protein